MLMGFLPFGATAVHSYMAIISWPMWPGYVKGMEVSVVDMLALAIYFSLPRARHPLPFRWSIGFYFLAVLLSVFQASVPTAALFYLWQLARVFLVYAVVARACVDQRVVDALLKGMAIGLGFEFCFVVWQHFGLGVTQASGTFGHQNLLGLASHFVVFPLFALLLAGERGWQFVVTPIVGVVIAVLTASRATVGLMGSSLVLVFTLSVSQRLTAQKAAIALFGAVSLAVLSPFAISSFEERFATAPLSEDYDERAALEKAAAMVLSDYPMGTGANNFVVIANTGGYYERAQVAWTSGSAEVHNAYWLAAAETGYIGLVAFVLFLIAPLIAALKCGWQNRDDRRGALLLGIGTGLLTVYVHSCFEWIFFLFPVQYLFAMTMGLVAGLTQQLGYWSRFGANRAKTLAASEPSALGVEPW
jgi:O-antigen ligase